MNQLRALSRTDRISYAAVAVLFLFLSLAVIAKAIILDNCMAFDAQDDVNHAFTGLHFAKELLGKGALPYINYYNNFGTPLMGDALTYPLGLHAIPYYLTDIDNYPVVMTINRFAICLATLWSLLFFYRTFNIGILSAAVAAIFAFFNFGYFWHFAHHHYQMTLLLAVCVFICQRAAIARKNHLMLFGSVTLLSALMIYSVSMNLIGICFLFFLVQPLLCDRSLKTFLVNVAALGAGTLLGSIQILATILAMMNSARAGVSYVDAFNLHFSSYTLMLRSFFQISPPEVDVNRHVYFAVYFPLSCLLMYLAGLHQMARKKDLPALRTSLVLGFLPVLVTAVFLVNGGLWRALPFFKSTDITRILWIAWTFVGIGIGIFSDSIRRAGMNSRTAWLIFIPLSVTCAISWALFFKEKLMPQYLWGYSAAFFLMLVCLIRIYLADGAQPEGESTSKWWRYSCALLLLLFALGSCYPVVHRLGNWRHPQMCTSVNHFSPTPAISPVLAEVMQEVDEKSRFAINVPSDTGIELISEIFGRHGAGGRSIAIINLPVPCLQKG